MLEEGIIKTEDICKTNAIKDLNCYKLLIDEKDITKEKNSKIDYFEKDNKDNNN